MIKPKVIVVGSSTTDVIVNLPRIPLRGETVLGNEYILSGGGKGANQAIALTRLGIDVTLVACVGDDQFGKEALKLYRREGINTQFVIQTARAPSAVAVVMVDSEGHNIIGVAPGANMHLAPAHLHAARREFERSSILLLQLAVPMTTVQEAVRIGRAHNLMIVMNPAPANRIPIGTMEYIDIITPNMTELSFLADASVHDAETTESAARSLLALGPRAVVATLGHQGALLVTTDEAIHIPAPVVASIDETGAGDAFNAGLIAGLLSGKPLPSAVHYGCIVGALATTRVGAQTALPWRIEVEKFLAERDGQS